MAKSFKYKDDNYLDSTGIVHNKELLSDKLNSITNSYVQGSRNDVSTTFSKSWTWYQIANGVTIPETGIYLVMYSAWVRNAVDSIGEYDLAFDINNSGYRAPRGSCSGGTASCNEIISLNKGDIVNVIMQMNKTGTVSTSNNSLIAIRLI